MTPSWSTPLSWRWGACRRLLGIKVYHDFRWSDLFPDERTQFKNGLSLARLVVDDCPQGKQPALLLTVDETAVERAIETHDEYVVVVRIRHYLREASGDAAAAYYAHGIRRRITQLAALEEVGNSPDMLVSFLEENLTSELVERWSNARPERREDLRRITSEREHGQVTASRVAEVLASMDAIPAEVWNVLVEMLPSLLDDETRQLLLNAITGDPNGRRITSQTLGARVAERIADTKEAVAEYERLILAEDTTESVLQRYIEDHPWMVGLDYSRVRRKALLPRGELDFCLERFDGFYDILELKSPADSIVLAAPTVDGVPPTASSYRLSPDLANALAQVHVYRDAMTNDAQVVERLYGLRKSRNPRLIIVIGRVGAMSDDRQRVLEQLNLSLSRVEIMPYDVLGRRAVGWLCNIESYLQSAR